MKKRIVILIYCFFIILLFSNITYSASGDLLFSDDFETGDFSGWSGNSNVDIVNDNCYSGSNCLKMDAFDDYVYKTFGQTYNTGMTMECYYRTSANIGDSFYQWFHDASNNAYSSQFTLFSISNLGSGKIDYYGNSQWNTLLNSYAFNEWQRIRITTNTTHTFVWYNKTINSSTWKRSLVSGSPKTAVLQLRGNPNVPMFIDDCKIWEGIKNPSFPELSMVNITIHSPTNNSMFNTDFDINYTFTTINATRLNATCNLYETNTTTTKILDTRNVVNGTRNTYNYNFIGEINKRNSYQVKCNTTTTSIYNSSIIYLTLDNIDPQLKSNIFNTTLISPKQFWFNFSDETLYSYRIKLGNKILANASNIVGTTANVSVTINPKNFSAGLHLLNITYSDGHTTREIQEMNIIKESREEHSLSFETTKNDYIKIKNMNTFDERSSINSKKLVDRYNILYERGSTEMSRDGDNLVFRVESSTPIVINSKTKYDGWLIVPDQNKWVDFETKTKVTRYELRRIDANTVDVYLYGVSDSKLTFESIGDLNTVTEYYWIGIANISMIYNPITISGSTQTMQLIMDFFGSEYVKNASARLWYNQSLKNTSLINYSDGRFVFSSTFLTPNVVNNNTFLFNWTYNATLTDDTVYYNKTNATPQKIFSLSVDNCSVGLYPWINITIFDENIPLNRLVADIEGEINLRYQDASSQINITLKDKNQYKICMSYENFVFDADVYLKYKTDNGFTHRYYIRNETFSKNIKYYSLYNYNYTAGVSNLAVTLRNKDDYSFFKEIIGKLQRKYVGEGVWRTVQMDKSGDYGEIFFNILEKDIDYRIIYTDLNNNILFTTTSSRFLCTDNLCSLTSILIPYSLTSTTTDLNVNAYYDNDTTSIVFDWNNPTGDVVNVVFYVNQETSLESKPICEQEVTASSGTYSCDIGGLNGVFSAIVRTHNSPLESAFSKLFEIPLGKLFQLTQIGIQGSVVWAFFIMLVVIMIGLFSPVGVIMAAIVGLIFIFWLGLMSAVTITMISVAAIIGIILAFKLKA